MTYSCLYGTGRVAAIVGKESLGISLSEPLKLSTNPFQAAPIGPQVAVAQARCGSDMNKGAFLIPVEFDVVHEAKQEGANFHVEIIGRLSNQPGPRPAAH